MAKSPTYRLHKSTGQACTTICGKTYYFGRHGSTLSKRKFNELLASYLLATDRSTFGHAVTELTMAEVARSYALYAKEYYGGESQEYRNILLALRPISKLIPRLLAKEFGPRQFKLLRQWWLDRDVSRQYTNQQMRRIIRAIKWLVSEDILSSTVHQAIKCVAPLSKGHCKAREAPPVTPVSDEILDATIPFLSSVVADMVRFQRLTGCRPGEVCKLTPSMVDTSPDIWEFVLDQHKTAWRGKKRIIYIGPKAQAILRPYLDRDLNDYCFSPRESMRRKQEAKTRSRTTPISCGNTPGSNRVMKPKRKPGNCYTTASYGRSIKYACRLAFPAPDSLSEELAKKWRSEKQWAPNQLRHSMATHVRKVSGIEAASILLGHSSLATIGTYAEQDRALAIEVVSRIG